MVNDLTYEDEEGNKLYGFSQQSLDENTKWTKFLVWAVGFMGIWLFMFFLYIIWLTVYIIKNNVINNIVGACV